MNHALSDSFAGGVELAEIEHRSRLLFGDEPVKAPRVTAFYRVWRERMLQLGWTIKEVRATVERELREI